MKFRKTGEWTFFPDFDEDTPTLNVGAFFQERNISKELALFEAADLIIIFTTENEVIYMSSVNKNGGMCSCCPCDGKVKKVEFYAREVERVT